MTKIRDRFQRSESVEDQKKHNGSGICPTTSRNWLQIGDIMTEDIASVCSGISIVAAAKIMSDKNISCLVVSDNGNLSGIITETDLLKRAVSEGNDFRKLKIEHVMSTPVRSFSRELTIFEASKIMEAENIRRLVVMDGEQVAGIITQTDIVRSLTSYSMWKNVEELMSPDVAAISKHATVKEAADLMSSRDISCLVAMNKNTVAGIFTERDLLKRVVALKRNPYKTILKNVMSSPVVSIPPNYSIPSASKLIEKKKIRRLLVMDDQKLLGVVTQTDILKAIKNNLQKEEENYIKILNESHNCIFIVDSNNITTYVNPALMNLLKVTNPEELINQPFLPEQFWENPNKRDQVLKQLKKVSVEVHDLILRTTKGKKLFVTLFSTRTKNIKGQTNGSQGILYDITAKKELANLRKMEQNLRRIENLLRGTLESTADGILVVNEKGRISHRNKRFAKIWDISEDIYRQQIDQKLFDHIRCQLENPSVFINKLKVPSPDNQDNSDILYLKEGKVLEVYSQPLIKEGRFAGRVWSFHDITRQKQAEEALNNAHTELEIRVEQRTTELEQANKVLKSEITERKKAEEHIKEQNEFLNLVIESLTHPFYVIDAKDYTIKMANSAAYMDPIPEELTCYKLTHKQDQPCTNPEHKCPLEEIKKTKQPIIVEHKHYDTNGNLRNIEVHAYPVFDKHGEVTQMIEYSLDITENKKNEKALEKLNKDLESTIHELKRTNKELQEFTYIAAHDLKTPLRGIGTLANWLLTDYADKFDEDGRMQVKMLVERAKRSDKLVDSILQYSKAGQSIEEHEKVDLNTVLPEIIREINPPENIEIIIDNKLPVIICKKTHINQIFENLIRNAIKYMDKEKGQIKVGCTEEDGFWKFNITDNGPGIDNKYHEKIFKIFQTLSQPNETSTGIGLSVAKKIVELNQGRIWVESNPGEGSTFYFTLPKPELTYAVNET
ncbi:MAG: CBS domain-containing protein [Sedimentisphaerales bacterium]|nr:CBS domain-containing protein [Sedimentisphaerales bacterium]